MALGAKGPVRALNPAVEVIAGRFTVSSGVCTVVSGIGFTPTESGTGVYTITLDKTYGACIAAYATTFGQATTGSTFYAEPLAFDASAPTFNTFALQTDATGDSTDLPNGDGLSFILVMQNSSLPNK